MKPDQLSALLEAQQEVIEKIALGADIYSCLNTICEQIEAIIGSCNAKSSILILEGNQLHHGAAPSLPKAFCDAVDGVEIGAKVGSCGTAVFTRQQVIVEDISTSPLWEDYKLLALSNDLKACWSTPIFSSHKDVLGSFAIYYTYVKAPSQWHLDLIARFTHLSSLAIEKAQSHRRKQALSRQLRQTNEKLQAFITVIPDLGFITDETGHYVDIYGDNKNLLFDESEKLIGKTISEVLPASDAQKIMAVINETLMSKQAQVYEYELNVPRGRRTFEARTSIVNHYLPDIPDRKHVLWMARDITERKRAELRVKQLAFFDPLTTLPNRRLLSDRLQTIIDKSIRHSLFGTLLFLDLDDFKRINDSLGHSIGDKLLLEVANRLKPALRNADTVARIGGDEFVIIPELLESNKKSIENESIIVAKKLLDCFSQPFRINKNEYKMTSSIGISVIGGSDITADEVLRRADTAMYRAKKMGGNHFSFYDPNLQHEIDLRLQLESEIITSIEKQEFKAYFQPQLDGTGKVIGAEALIRWLHPEKGVISPLCYHSDSRTVGLDTFAAKYCTDRCLHANTAIN
jgi:diguanylate cyclase (GGDEF)-like protein/PAS domain S-box-containing protein